MFKNHMDYDFRVIVIVKLNAKVIYENNLKTYIMKYMDKINGMIPILCEKMGKDSLSILFKLFQV